MLHSASYLTISFQNISTGIQRYSFPLTIAPSGGTSWTDSATVWVLWIASAPAHLDSPWINEQWPTCPACTKQRTPFQHLPAFTSRYLSDNWEKYHETKRIKKSYFDLLWEFWDTAKCGLCFETKEQPEVLLGKNKVELGQNIKESFQAKRCTRNSLRKRKSEIRTYSWEKMIINQFYSNLHATRCITSQNQKPLLEAAPVICDTRPRSTFGGISLRPGSEMHLNLPGSTAVSTG